MRSKEHDDKRLACRLLDGNDEAFEEFFEAMYPALYRSPSLDWTVSEKRQRTWPRRRSSERLPSSRRRHRVKRHRATMIWLFVGALIVAGLFTLRPGRIMRDVAFGP